MTSRAGARTLLDRYADDPDAPGDRAQRSHRRVTATLTRRRAAMRAQVSDLPGVRRSSASTARTAPDAEPTPPTVALVREDGVLVVVDLETGEQRELHTDGDPRRQRRRGGRSVLHRRRRPLARRPVGVLLDLLRAGGRARRYRIPVDRRRARAWSTIGAYPRVSPDGRFRGDQPRQLVVRHHRSTARTRRSPRDRRAASARWPGRRTAASWPPSTSTGPSGEPPGAAVRLGRHVAHPGRPGQARQPRRRFVVLDSRRHAHHDQRRRLGRRRPQRSARTPATEWLLWVDEAGVVREQAGFESGELPPIEGLPEALVADW